MSAIAAEPGLVEKTPSVAGARASAVEAEAPVLKTPHVSVVVLSWNREENLKRCLKSLQRLEYPNLTIHVVDNGSTSFDPRQVEGEFPGVQWTFLGAHVGVAQGRNVALEKLLAEEGTEFLLFLDDDSMAHPRLVQRLVDVHDFQRGWDILQPAVYEIARPETLYACGGAYNYFTGKARNVVKMRAPEDPGDEAAPVDFVLGCCLFTHRGVFDSLGSFDTDFTLCQGEDADFCLRAWGRNFGSVVVPDAILWHEGPEAGADDHDPSTFYFEGERRVCLLKRHARPWHWVGFLLTAPILVLGLLLRETARGNPAAGLALARGIRSGLRGSRPLPRE